MKEIVLPAIRRETSGKTSARASRREGRIPGVVYGPELDSFPVAVNETDLRAAIKQAGGTNAIYSIDVGDGSTNKVIVREMQSDPVTNKVVHIDFHAISMNKPINVRIPIHFVGTPVGVRQDGGILQTPMRELEIEALPDNIPEYIEVNVEDLNIGDSIHVSTLNVPNAEILSDPQRTLVVISAPTIVKAATTTEEGEEAELEGEEAAEGAEGEEAAEGAEEEGEAQKKEGKESKEKKEKKED